MTDKKLTENFKLSEFISTDPTDYQLQLLQILADNLQLVRTFLQEFVQTGKKSVSIMITSGVRTQADYERLVKNGYNPSKTSDHFCGYQLTAKPTLGAADITIKNCSLSLKAIAAKIIEWDKAGLVHFGQVIYEKNPKTGSEWIHLGNDPKLIFNHNIDVQREKYLMSLDNGKTYKKFKL
jgi:hypothetical protein